MQITNGTDMIEVSRIEEAIEENKESFLDKVYTKSEITYCEAKKIAKYQHYAGRFAAKEAIFKAISPFLENKYDISWKNIEIINDEKGRPKVHFIGICFSKMQQIDVSISHLKEYATSTAVVMWK